MWPVEHLIQWDAGFFDHQIFWKESIEILVFLHGVSHQGRVAPDWRSDATGHTRPIVEVSDPHFSWWLPPCKKSYFLKNVWLMPSRDIDDQRILQYDWTRHTTGHIQPKVVVSNPSFSWWLSPCKKTRYQLISSRYIDDQRILQSDWMRGTTGHTQPKVKVLDPSFSWWLSPCKNSEISIDSFHRHWCLENPAI